MTETDEIPLADRIQFLDDVSVQLIQSVGTDSTIIAAARVSTQGDESLDSLESGEADGLISFLMKNRHGSPFEHNLMTFYIKAPIFVFREFHRHRIGWSYNEESGRYKQLEPHFYVPSEARNLIQVGKTGHYNFVPGDAHQYGLMADGHMRTAYDSYVNYEEQLAGGIAKEVARMSLPENIFSSMYATCNARSLMAFLSLRTAREDATFPSSPQREIEMVAEKMEAEFARLFPITHSAFDRFGRVCP